LLGYTVARSFVDSLWEEQMKTILVGFAAVALIGWAPFAADTMKGKISDSMCGAKHSGGEHAGATNDRTCTEKCIKNGEKYVFVSGDKVYKIANQDMADLKAHAGHEVEVTGETKGDTITVSKIVMPKAESKKK
jgi:hypothetical protein